MKNIKKYRVSKNKKLRGGSSNHEGNKIKELFNKLRGIGSFDEIIENPNNLEPSEVTQLLNDIINQLMGNLLGDTNTSYSIVTYNKKIKKNSIDNIKQLINLIKSSYNLYCKSVIILTGEYKIISSYCVVINNNNKIKNIMNNDLKQNNMNIPIDIAKYVKVFLTSENGDPFPGIDGRFTNKDISIKSRSTQSRVSDVLSLLTPAIGNKQSDKSLNSSRSFENFSISTNNFIATINIILNDLRNIQSIFSFKKTDIYNINNANDKYGIDNTNYVVPQDWSNYFEFVSNILVTILDILFKNSS